MRCAHKHRYKQLIKQGKLEDLKNKASQTPGWVDDIVINAQIVWYSNSWLRAVVLLMLWILVSYIIAAYDELR